MTINIENCIRHSKAEPQYQFILEDLVKHLKELRDRTEAGDEKAIVEFFELYRFDDSRKRVPTSIKTLDAKWLDPECREHKARIERMETDADAIRAALSK